MSSRIISVAFNYLHYGSSIIWDAGPLRRARNRCHAMTCKAGCDISTQDLRAWLNDWLALWPWEDHALLGLNRFWTWTGPLSCLQCGKLFAGLNFQLKGAPSGIPSLSFSNVSLSYLTFWVFIFASEMRLIPVTQPSCAHRVPLVLPGHHPQLFLLILSPFLWDSPPTIGYSSSRDRTVMALGWHPAEGLTDMQRRNCFLL